MLGPETYSTISMGLDHKPFSGEGTESAEVLYTMVGHVCAGFERLQDEVVLLFQFLCDGPAAGISKMSQIIGVTSSFNTKLDLTKQAAKTFLADEPGKRDAILAWLKLCSRAAEIRNKVAHGHPSQVAFRHQAGSRQAAFLTPSALDPRKAPLTARGVADWAYCWNAQQLQEYVGAFVHLTAMMMTVREELAGAAEEPHPWVLDPSALVRGKAETLS